MSIYLPADLRQQLREVDDQRCAYWDAEGVRINGTTAIGRATVIALQLNNDVIVPARRRWVSAGWHPPGHS